jgi:hypothetical protein
MSNPSHPHAPQGTQYLPDGDPRQFGQDYQQPPLTAQQARARAKAAKAEAKALRPWYKKKRFIIPLVLVALFVLVNLSGGGAGDTTSAAPAGASSAQAKEQASAKKQKPTRTSEAASVKIGEAAKAGDWTFTVTKFTCGSKTIGSEYLNKKAQGQFCLMNLSVKNNGNEAATLMSDNQKLLDAKGREFASDNEASLYVDPDSNIFIEDINPGNTAKGVVVFDVPKNVKPVTATLAGGVFGVKDVVSVDLR